MGLAHDSCDAVRCPDAEHQLAVRSSFCNPKLGRKVSMTGIAISGLGRIGRAALKIIMDTPGLKLVAVNNIVPIENIGHLLKYDTVYGRYDKTVKGDGDNLIVGEKTIRYLSEKDPARLLWSSLGVDVLLECTGVFTKDDCYLYQDSLQHEDIVVRAIADNFHVSKAWQIMKEIVKAEKAGEVHA